MGLLRGKSWGLDLSVVHAALGLLWVPISTTVRLFILKYLEQPEEKESSSVTRKAAVGVPRVLPGEYL